MATVVRGSVRAARPVPGAAVSNGELVVETDNRGLFELRLDPERHLTLFVTVPDGYDAANGFYRYVPELRSGEAVEFRLRKRRRRVRGVFLHVADTHLEAAGGGPISPSPGVLAADLRRMIVEEPGADMIVATGDLTGRGDGESLRAWQRITSKAHPKFVSVFGGHDDNWLRRRPAAESLLPWTRNFERYVAPAYYSFDWCGHHFVAYANEHEFLGEQRSAMRDRWLRADLARVKGRMPVIMLTHCPPGEATASHPGRFVRQLAKLGVVAIFFGHWHSWKTQVAAGVKVFSTGCLPFGSIDARPAGYRRVRINGRSIEVSSRTLWKLDHPSAPPRGADVLWRRRISGGMHRTAILSCQDRLLISLCDEDLKGAPGVVALDAATGRTLWRVATDASVKNAVALGPGSCAAVSVTGEIVVIGTDSGRCLWRRRLRGHPDRWIFTSPLIASGLVVAGTAFGLEARQQSTGTLVWQWKHERVTTDAWSHYAGPFQVGERLVVPCMRQGLTALRLADGSPLWEAKGHVEYPLAQPVSDGKRIFTPFSPATLATLDAASGRTLRSKDLGEGVLSALSAGNSTVYSVTTGGALRAQEARSGRLMWSAKLGRDRLAVTPYQRESRSAWARPLIVDGMVILACADGVLRVHDARSGRLIRKVTFPDLLTATPCLLDGKLYLGTYSGVLWALRWDSAGAPHAHTARPTGSAHSGSRKPRKKWP